MKLKKIRGPTIQQAGYHQVNMIATKISSKLQQQLSQQDAQLLDMFQTLQTSDQENIPLNYAVACTTTQSDNTQLEILCALQELHRDLNNIKSSSSNTSNQQTTGSSTRKYARKTPDAGGRLRKNISKYCWTHRACAHTSKDCPDKADKYQNIATFENKMKGSKARYE